MRGHSIHFARKSSLNYPFYPFFSKVLSGKCMHLPSNYSLMFSRITGYNSIFFHCVFKERQFFDFLFASLGDITIPERSLLLTLKAPITTAADDIHKYFLFFFQRK